MVCVTFATYVHDVIEDKKVKPPKPDTSNATIVSHEEAMAPGAIRRRSPSSLLSSSKGGSGPSKRDNRQVRVMVQSEALNQEVLSDAFSAHMGNFVRRFDDHMREFMECLMKDSQAQYHPHLSNLCTRMEYWRPKSVV